MLWMDRLRVATIEIAAVEPIRGFDVARADGITLGERALWFRWLLLATLCTMALAGISLLVRPALPVDETRYLAVAWEMWTRGDFLVPHLNGAAYDHKPPLLFWLMHLGWWLFGVNEWWPRMISPICALVAIIGLERLASILWPQHRAVGRIGSLMFLSASYFAIYQTAVMFDALLLACVTSGWYTLVRASNATGWRWWAIFGVCMGLGGLAKGPVVLVYLLPPAIAMRWWLQRTVRAQALHWALAALIAISIPALWIVAAAHAAPAEYLNRVLIDQTLHRVHGQIGHPRAFWWYLLPLVLLHFPWVLWPRLVRSVARLHDFRMDTGVRFTAITAACSLLILSAISGKQIHYLIPIVALSFLMLARALTAPSSDVRKPIETAVRRGMLASLVCTLLVLIIAFGILRPRYDLAAAGDYAGAQASAGRPLAYVGKYQGELQFFGRLRQPVATLKPSTAMAWLQANPTGLVIARLKRMDLRGTPVAEFDQHYKSDRLLMFNAQTFIDSGSQFRTPAS